MADVELTVVAKVEGVHRILLLICWSDTCYMTVLKSLSQPLGPSTFLFSPCDLRTIAYRCSVRSAPTQYSAWARRCKHHRKPQSLPYSYLVKIHKSAALKVHFLTKWKVKGVGSRSRGLVAGGSLPVNVICTPISMQEVQLMNRNFAQAVSRVYSLDIVDNRSGKSATIGCFSSDRLLEQAKRPGQPAPGLELSHNGPPSRLPLSMSVLNGKARHNSI